MPTTDKNELMRECVVIAYTSGQSGVKNAVFDITIPEGYALEIADVDFGIASGANPVANRIKMLLVDDPDEQADPGYAAEKVIQSTELHFGFVTSGRTHHYAWETKDCHKTMLVVNPNLIADMNIDPAATVNIYARIWFDFIKISNQKILELLRQQQY